MKAGNLVKRCPKSWEYLYPHELEEVGIIVKIEIENNGDIYAIVMWPLNEDISWEDPDELVISYEKR